MDIDRDGDNEDIVRSREYGRFGELKREYLPYRRSLGTKYPDLHDSDSSNWQELESRDRAYAFVSMDYEHWDVWNVKPHRVPIGKRQEKVGKFTTG